MHRVSSPTNNRGRWIFLFFFLLVIKAEEKMLLSRQTICTDLVRVKRSYAGLSYLHRNGITSSPFLRANEGSPGVVCVHASIMGRRRRRRTCTSSRRAGSWSTAGRAAPPPGAPAGRPCTARTRRTCARSTAASTPSCSAAPLLLLHSSVMSTSPL